MCPGDSVLAGGSYQYTSGNYVDSLNTINGCDSIVTTTVLLYPEYSATINAEICDNETYTTPDGGIENITGIYEDTLTTVNGCDSIFIINLTVHPTYNDVVFAEICANETYTRPGGGIENTTGIYTDSLLSINNCDSVVITNLVVHEIYDTTVTEWICPGDSIFLAGAYQYTAGNYVDSLQSIEGCDSILTTQVFLYQEYDLALTEWMCPGDSMFIAGSFRYSSGVFVDSLNTINGCDSIVSTTLLLYPNYSDTYEVTMCNGDSTLAGGAYQYAPGTYVDSLLTTNGCDSIIYTNVIVLATYQDTNFVEICDGESVILGGALQTTSGTYIDQYTSSLGCDSIIVSVLQVNPTYDLTDNAIICDGDSILLGGTYQFASGIYIDTFATSSNCDSIITTTLMVAPNYEVPLNASICNGDSILLGGMYQTTGGTYYDTLATEFGCDSVLVTSLTILPTYADSFEIHICPGDSVLLAGDYQTETGTYVDSLLTNVGCDSLIITDLIVRSTCIDTVYVEICEPNTYFVGGAEQSLPGFYIDTLLSSVNTDSIVVTGLTVHPEFLSNEPISICEGDSIYLGGAWQTTTGIYTDSLSTINGCDSVINWMLSIDPISYQTINASICEGQQYFLNGSFITEPGVYIDTLQVPNGCPQIVTTILVVNPVYLDTLIQEICEGDSYFVGGANQTMPGFYSDSLTSINNCDSTIVTQLIVHPEYHDTTSVSICQGETFVVNGQGYTTSQTIYDNQSSIHGCDSIHVYFLDVIAPIFNYDVANLCTGDGIIINGQYITEAGTYSDTLTAASTNCDSINVTLVQVFDHAFVDTLFVICEGDSIFAGGAYQTMSGIYVDSLMTGSGCDSIITTELIVETSVDLIASDAILCVGETVDLLVEGATNVNWSPGNGLSCTDCPNPTASPLETTTYTIWTNTCLGGTVQTTLTVFVEEPPSLTVAADDLTVVLGESTELTAFTNDPTALITWMDIDGNIICEDCSQITVTPTQTTVYFVSVENESGCNTSTEITVRIDDSCSNATFEIPNMISPNGDGANDVFRIKYDGVNDISILRIFNRWGQLVYETTDIGQFWDGSFRGKQLNPGVYVYYLEGTCLDDEQFIKTGNVTILK